MSNFDFEPVAWFLLKAECQRAPTRRRLDSENTLKV